MVPSGVKHPPMSITRPANGGPPHGVGPMDGKGQSVQSYRLRQVPIQGQSMLPGTLQVSGLVTFSRDLQVRGHQVAMEGFYNGHPWSRHRHLCNRSRPQWHQSPLPGDHNKLRCILRFPQETPRCVLPSLSPSYSQHGDEWLCHSFSSLYLQLQEQESPERG